MVEATTSHNNSMRHREDQYGVPAENCNSKPPIAEPKKAPRNCTLLNTPIAVPLAASGDILLTMDGSVASSTLNAVKNSSNDDRHAPYTVLREQGLTVAPRQPVPSRA